VNNTSSNNNQFDLFKNIGTSTSSGNKLESKPSIKNKDFELFASGFQKPSDKPTNQDIFNFL
jgi:hypothetical protein